MTALPTPMSESEARQITTRISLRLTTIADNAEAVVELIEKAKAGDAHAALGYPSWTAYVTDKFGGTLSRLEKAERVPIVAQLAESGMSVRAIAAVTDTSKSTIDREVSHRGTPATGTDGKSYSRPETFLKSGKPTAEAMQDISSKVPPVRPKARKRPLPDSYNDHTWKIHKAAESLSRLHQDDRFTRNRDSVRDRSASWLARAANELCDLLDDLGVDRHHYGPPR